jgi:hypothetical protein
MKTPYGSECKYFYGDYFRGKNIEECRLLNLVNGQGGWTVKLCKSCPAPRIQSANGCEFMRLNGKLSGGFLGLSPHIVITAFCQNSQTEVKEPSIGCGKCHEFPSLEVNVD